jgi:hypothetical protein
MKFLRLHHPLELRIHCIDELTLDFVGRRHDLSRSEADVSNEELVMLAEEIDDQIALMLLI